MPIRLIYNGGGAFYHVPARDLTDEDFTERAEIWAELGINEATLIHSGLYRKPEAEQVETKKKRGDKHSAEKEGE